MKKLFLLIAVIILSYSCKKTVEPLTQSKKKNNTTTNTNKADENNLATFFVAGGLEPTWSLEISKDLIKINGDFHFSGLEDVTFPSVYPTHSIHEPSTKTYTIYTKLGTMEISIKKIEYTDPMSGRKSPYTVKIEIPTNILVNEVKIIGGGNYITDYPI